ncbi:MAG: hypothetical protein M1830_002855 [Pleopsidium flavum]|nr:MAG: hypothetical protein M1830_002855 [Pleopsidium flavum]
MPTAVVTGANSGIGHAFAQILLYEGYEVYATDISPGPKLLSLGDHAHTVQLDVGSPQSIDSFTQHFGDQELDLLLNIAGIMAAKEKDTLTTTNLEILSKTFTTNTYGPLLLTQALLPNLLRSARPRIGIMSSRVGSIGDNSTGGSYAYRASKAALNSISKSMAMDLRDQSVLVVIMHPGYVKTGIDPSTHDLADAVEPEEAAQKLWKVFNSKKLEETGRFWHREGMELPW